MTGVLYRLARFSVRHRFAVLGAWILVAVALVGVSHRLGDNTNDNVTLPGTNSQQAADALSKSFPDQANGSSPIVLHVSSGKLTDSQYAGAVNQAAADVARAPDVVSVDGVDTFAPSWPPVSTWIPAAWAGPAAALMIV